MTLELALAPGISDSASSLSNPCMNEFVNSFIKLDVYVWVSGISGSIAELPGLELKSRRKFGRKDSLKSFAISAARFGDSLVSVKFQGCSGLRKQIRNTKIFWTYDSDFDNPDVTFFKQVMPAH